MHLVQLHRIVNEFKPDVVIIDPITDLSSAGDESHSMLIRLIDFLRRKNVTAFFVSLTTGGKALETTDAGMSSIVDTWLLLSDVEHGGERNRHRRGDGPDTPQKPCSALTQQISPSGSRL